MNDQESMDRLIARIDQLAHLPDGEHSVDWAGASSQAALTALEQALGVRISGSFRTFILKTGGGGLDSLCISTIPASEPLGGLGSVHGDTLHYREGWAAPLPAHLVVIQRSQRVMQPRLRSGAGRPLALLCRRMQVHGDRREPLFQRGLQRRVVVQAQVVAEPDKGVGHAVNQRKAARFYAAGAAADALPSYSRGIRALSPVRISYGMVPAACATASHEIASPPCRPISTTSSSL